MAKTLVVALGGNAFLRKGEKGTIEEQLANALKAAKVVADAVEKGYHVAVTHGNGPQVGVVLEWMEALKNRIPPLPMDVANAMTQGWLGYLLQQAIGNELEKRGLARRVVTIVTQVLVDPRDEAFKNPTKYVGPYYYDEELVEKLARERGWVFKKDPRGGWRRVVPSPKPLRIVEVDAVKDLLERGFIVISVGGGGVPVVEARPAVYRGVEAVIDKDLASALLASSIGANYLAIFTDIDGVYLGFGKPGQKKIGQIRARELRRYYDMGEFPPGSMGPKVLAAIEFIERGGEKAFIGSLDDGIAVIEEGKGTTIIP